MRYEDASQTGALSQGSEPNARNDADSIAAGAHAPATGNLITGEGTQTGPSGADSAAGGHITSIAGAGGQDSSFAGGKLQAVGEFGRLTVDAQGNYNYLAKAGTPENSRDHFTYTLADSQGNSDTATLTIDIGKTPAVIKANAQQVVPGPDGVVTLPPGVELSDVHVVGRNLVIDLPDGGQMVIVDGAVFVPQLVLNGVEVPATNLAALLIGSEPQPAAGDQPSQSSGGNFEVPVGPLDPGVPLGDLIPPTENHYIPPEVKEVIPGDVDREPAIFIEPDGQVRTVSAVDEVSEAGLPTRPGEPEGSGEEAAAGANGDTSETTTGSIIVESPDEPNTISINGVVVSFVNQVFHGAYGDLTITSITDGAIGYSYTLLDNTSGNVTHDDFSVTVTDDDGDTATATLVVSIVDDVPTARPDTDVVPAGTFGPATGNIITDAAAGDAGDSDNGRDTLGADDADLTAITGFGSTEAGEGGFVVQGQYGVLTIDADGNYSYVRNPNSPGNVNDVFNYTLTDGDGDTSSSTLTIHIDNSVPTFRDFEIDVDDDSLPGGLAGGIGDGPDAVNTVGAFSAFEFGGDGPLTFTIQLTGAPPGFAFVSGGPGVVLLQQDGVTLRTITYDPATGTYSVVQNAAGHHAPGGEENDAVFVFTLTVTDADGDTATGHITLVINDDTPEVTGTLNREGSVTVDESGPTGASTIVFTGIHGNDENVAGSDPIGRSVGSSSVVDAASVQFGADGPAVGGGIGYQLQLGGTDTPLTLTDGSAIQLQLINGVVVGIVTEGSHSGEAAFAISVNATTGIATVEMYLSLDHPLNPNPNDSLPLGPDTVSVVVTATDSDGDTASSAPVDISDLFNFLDDGPSLTPTVNANATVTVDETLPSNDPLINTGAIVKGDDPDLAGGLAIGQANSGGAIVNANALFGADGPAAGGGLSYALSISNPASGLTLTDGSAINLQLVGGVIVGVVAGGAFAGQAAFAIAINASTGVVSVEQYLSLDHPINPNPNDPLGLGENTVGVTVTATDGDGDPVTSDAVDISGQITFLDDGPAIDPAVNAQATVTVDESLPSNVPVINTGAIVKGDDPDLAGGQALGQANSGVAVVNANAVFGADGAAIGGGLTYALTVESSNSGVTLTDGTAINLQLVGGVIVGVVAGGAFAGQAAFAIAIDPSSGVVSVEQYLSLDHPINPNPNDPLGLGPNTVGVTVSGTDGDGDPVTSDAVDISGQITFLDDGPTLDPGVNANATVVVDESLPSNTPGINTGAIVKGDDPDLAGGQALGQANSGAAIVNAGAVFGADGPAAGGGLAYSLSISNPASGVTLTDGSAINLQLVGGVIVGVVASGAFAGQAAFAIAIDPASGVVTVEQYLSLDHPINPNPNDPLGLGENTIAAHVVATDGDGDSVDSGAIDISGQITFLDDGPSAVPTVNANATVTVDESLPSDTPGINTGAIVKGNDPDLPGGIALGQANSGSAIVNANAVFGADGPAASNSVSYALSVINAPSGVTLTDGSAINLQLVGGVIVGVVAGGTFAGQAAFAIAINSSTGVVTVEQYLSLDHPINPNPNDPLGLGANTVGVTVTATDGDGDPVTSAAVDVSGQITFLDDGPTAANDVDSIVGGNGPATGNVITGVDFVGGDANSTDGSADAPGADGGSITFIDHSNGAPGAVVPGAGSVAIAGDYGVLTIFANGNYSYLRNDGSPGGVSDVFTYTLTDGDGDPITATLTIAIDDHFPTAGNVDVQLDDDALPGGNPGTPAVNDDPDSVNASGFLPGSGGDPALTWDLLTTGNPAGFTYVDGVGGSVEVFQGAVKVLTITVNAATGQYTVTQNNPILHTAGNLENNTSFTINYVVKDADNDPANGTIHINVDDDTPVVNVTQTGESGVLLTTQDAQTDGVPTDTDTDVSSANFGGVFGLTQSIGADGGAAGSLGFALAVTDSVSGFSSHGVAINLYNVGGVIVGSTAANAGAITAGNTIFNIAVSGTGVVTLSQFQQIDHPIAGDPTPTITPFEDHLAILANGKVTLTASVTITDNDGDPATDQEVIDLGGNIRFADDGPIAANDSVNQVTENSPITFSVFGNDQFGADGVDIDNNPTVNVTFTQPASGSVSYNPATGQFTFTPAPGQTGSPTFTYTIIDFDGDTSTATVTVNLQPDSTPQTTNGVAAVDDDGLAGGNAASVTGDLDANAGEAAPVNPSEAVFHGQLVATGGGDTIANYNFASMNGTNGTVGTETVLYSWNNGSSTLTATTVGGTRPGTALFEVVVNQATGSYNLTLLDNVLHAAGSNENDATTALTFTATDSDGDPANGTVTVTFDDDAPTLGAVQSQQTDNNPLTAPAVGTLHFAAGADGAGSTMTITANVTGLHSGGFNLITQQAGNVLTAYQDTNGDGIHQGGEATAVFTITVNPNAGTSGQYVFDLITALDPTVTETAIGGSSSFGAGPTAQGQVLDNVAGTQHLAVVSGYHMGGTFNEATWLSTGSAGPASNYVTAGVNGSTAGWGIDNNNFNGTDELFVWDFGSQALRNPDGDPAPPGPDANDYSPPPGVVLPDISTATFDLIGYGSPGDDITYVVHYTDGTFTSGHIPPADIDDGTWKFTAAAGKFIGDIEMFTSPTGSGKVDLVSVGVQNSTLDVTIPATVTLTDGDGDATSTGAFNVHVQTGLVPFAPAAPVALDLNGDGVHFLGTEAGVAYDYGHGQVATAWVGPDDGILVHDANGNGNVDGASEFVFGANGQTDMQALAAQYGSTLDANDADYAKFGVWQDANSNGAVDAGEYQTLAAAGITSINLVSNGVSYSAAGGDVDVAGSATYTKSDGSSGIVADAAFLTGGLGAQDQLRMASTSNIALAAAVAAAGLAAQAAPAAAPAAEEADHGQDVAAVAVSAGPAVAPAADQADDASRSALTNEAKEPANDAAPAESSSHSSSDSHESSGLDVASASSSDSSSESHDAVDQGPAAATASLAPSAQEVAMPSAEALQAAGLTGEAQHGGSVEKIVAAALGSAAAPTVDALLQSLSGGGHDGPDALASLASPTAAHVPGWDMPAQGAFGHGAEMMIMMHAQMLHQDAVQPTANG